MNERRRATTREERLSPCHGCGFPLTHRHHLLEFANYGENDCTVQVCGTCHDLFQIVESCYVWKHADAKRLVGELVQRIGFHNERFSRIYDLVVEAKRLRNIADKASCEAVENAPEAPGALPTDRS